ncbi:hypothetical protein [Butyrivibrio sp. AE3004]|uniref:hypothetical protein n=1 Tax=Butyrivibrio sp. AE3004 TaxID=1506994 RepID=UPI000494B7D9|nr:hypothetical protein [Butyrivibrio sp. AE3004]
MRELKRFTKLSTILYGLAASAVITASALFGTIVAPNGSITAKAANVDYSAESYTLGTQVNYKLNAREDKWYKLTLDKSYIVNVKHTTEQIFIYDSTGNQVGAVYKENISENEALLKGDYYVLLHNTKYDAVDTSFSIMAVDPDSNYQSFVEEYYNGSTRNDSKNLASAISGGNTYHGLIGINNAVDWYKFTVDGKTTVTFFQTEYRGYGTTMFLLDENDKRLIDKFCGNGGPTASTTVSAGTYYVYVERYNSAYNKDGICSYQIVLGQSEDINKSAKDLINTKPGLKVKKKGKVIVSFKKAANVDGYEIQVSNKKNFKGTTKNYSVGKDSNKTTITLPKKLRGKKIYVRVRAYSQNGNEKTYSNWSLVASKKSKR